MAQSINATDSVRSRFNNNQDQFQGRATLKLNMLNKDSTVGTL